jgi:cellulose synthase/poly-beta-1,6-N-acetylglucosamine synthase-like glycosyltransferase
MSNKKKIKNELKDSATACYSCDESFISSKNIELLGQYNYSASRFFLSKSQALGILFILISSLLGLIFYREITILALLTIGFSLYFILTLVKHKIFLTKVIMIGRNFIKRIIDYTSNNSINTDFELPIYSILLPIFKESKEVIEQLFTALDKLDYPKDKKQILLLVEESDQETLKIIKTIVIPINYQLIIIPDFFPRTKAKACNYALQFVKGEFLVIFDADDIPEANQLLVVLDKFKTSLDKQLACVQAKLNYYNANENLLTKLFSLEYSILFDKILPGLANRKAPLPLGGSSNHFKVEVLKALKGWDIYNLTEDAEIGMRLAYHGYSTDLVNSYTLEEAPVTIYAWLKQRARWLKGFIQTYCLYLQNKYHLEKKVGFKKNFLSLHFMLGLSTLSLLLTPIMLMSGSYLFYLDKVVPSVFYKILHLLTLASSSVWITTISWQSYQTIKVSPFLQKNNLLDKIKCISIFPCYFILHVLAAFYAVFDLILRPFYWSKTQHGIAKEKNYNYLTEIAQEDNHEMKKDE